MPQAFQDQGFPVERFISHSCFGNLFDRPVFFQAQMDCQPYGPCPALPDYTIQTVFAKQNGVRRHPSSAQYHLLFGYIII